MEEARRAFEQARAFATDPGEQARLDIYIASTYAIADSQQTIDRYLAVLNTELYPRDERSLAGALMLVYIQNTSQEEWTSYVFSKAPFVGLYREDSPSVLINREVAYSRAHHLLVSTYGPNFVSYLTAGSIYAYIYPHVDASVQSLIGPRIPEYFVLGKALLNDAIANRSVHPSIIALGLRTLSTYTEDYAQLAEDGLIGTSSAPDASAILLEYRRALDYAYVRAHNIDAVTKFTTTLRYVSYLGASADLEQMRSLSASALSLSSDPAVQRLMRQSGESTIEIGPFHAYRTALKELGQADTDLRAMLEQLGWTTEDFLNE